MKTQWMKRALVGMGALMAVGGFSGVASAASDTVYGGGQCMPKTASDGYYLARYTLFLANDGQTMATVICPVDRTNTTNTTGTSAAWVRVKSNAGASLTCQLSALGQYGNVIQTKAVTTTSNNDTSLNVDVNSSAANGHYAIQCVVPPGGRVYSYRIMEP